MLGRGIDANPLHRNHRGTSGQEAAGASGVEGREGDITSETSRWAGCGGGDDGGAFWSDMGILVSFRKVAYCPKVKVDNSA